MHKLLVITAFLGLLVSGYLLITYTSPTPLVCGEGSGCHKVQASTYAAIFGLPTPLYGVFYYLLLGILAALWSPTKKTTAHHLALVLLTGTGFAVTAWLTYLEAFVINAWCAWCVASAALATIAFSIVWLHPKRQ